MNILNISFCLNQFNYGQRLQSYALQAYLKKQFNIDVSLVDRGRSFRDFQSFEDDLMKRISMSWETNLKDKVPEVDAIVYGGDQIWNYCFCKEEDLSNRIAYKMPYEIVHIPYSASINGTNGFFNSKKLMDVLGKSKFISVREKQDADRINNRFNELGIDNKATYHIDPALLLKRCDYEKISRKPNRKLAKKFNFGYTVGHKVEDSIENGVQTYNEIGNDDNPPKYVHLDPREWIWMIQHCEKLITSSFHGFAFGVLFNKKIEFETNYRIQNLIDILDIKFKDGVITNYDDVIKKLNQERERSRQYFAEALSQVGKFNSRREYCAYSKSGRDMSTSGGISAELAKGVFSKGGIVYGAAYSKDFRSVNIIPVTNMIDYYKHIAGSKYSISTMPKFKDVKSNLDSGKFVMFTGCPCQIKALKTYLGKNYDNLVLVDLLCSGISARSVLANTIDEIEKEHGSKLISFNMRHNHKDVSYYTLENGESGVVENLDSYQHFINSCRLEMCKKCNLHMGGSSSDITIGDFWSHYNKGRVTDEKFSPTIGTNWVIVNSQKGLDLLESIKNNIEYLRIQ